MAGSWKKRGWQRKARQATWGWSCALPSQTNVSLCLGSNILGSMSSQEQHVGHGKNYGHSLSEGIYGNSDFYFFFSKYDQCLSQILELFQVKSWPCWHQCGSLNWLWKGQYCTCADRHMRKPIQSPLRSSRADRDGTQDFIPGPEVLF